MITLISALFPALDQTINQEKWKDLLSLLIETKIPLVLYVDSELIESLETSFDLSSHVIRVMDHDKLTQGLWLFDKFYKLGKEQNLTDEALISLLIRIRSLGWLNDESIFNPFHTTRFVWLDPTLLDEINPCYLQSEGGVNRIAPLLSQMLILQRPGGEVEESISSKLFGGNCSVLSTVNNAYWNAYAETLNRGQLPCFPSLINSLCLHMPENFSRFILQSNGLEGAFFETINKGIVPIETTYVNRYE